MSTNEEIKDLIINLKVVVSALEAEKEQIFESIPLHKKSLEEQLKKISNTNIALQSVPKQFTEKLEASVPKIIEQLKTVVLEEMNNVKNSYTDDMINHANFLRDNENRIKKISDDMSKIDKKRLKMFFIGVIISSTISIAGATYGASYMMQTFPTRVTIDKPENIILYDSDVSLWGTENVKVLKGLKKNDRKNSRKY